MKKRSFIAVGLGVVAVALTAGFLMTAQVSAQGAFPDTGGGLPGFPGGPDYTGNDSGGTTTIPGVGGAGFTGTTTSGGGTTTTTNPTTTTSSSSGYCANSSGTILASGSKVGDVLKYFTCLIQNSIIPLLFMLALATFIWGMVKFISAQQSAEKEDGKQFMLWGVIALAVMFSVWGLVKILQDTFQVKNAIPQLTVPNSN